MLDFIKRLVETKPDEPIRSITDRIVPKSKGVVKDYVFLGGAGRRTSIGQLPGGPEGGMLRVVHTHSSRGPNQG